LSLQQGGRGFPTPSFSSVDRIVIDTEGRVVKLAALGAALPGKCTLIRIVPLGSASSALPGRGARSGPNFRMRT
jgi:hypothetical protein